MISPFEISYLLHVLEKSTPFVSILKELPEISIDQKLPLREHLMFLLCLLVEFVLEEILKLVNLSLQIKE